ncbi:MAG TPA: hypothetical protein VJN88_12510 [Ktedonobacterales bacterium]|nr:hypothetical protein [Ktedonobacterales bacterium]
MSIAPNPDTQRAFEELYVTFYRYACRNLPNFQQHNTDDLFWIVTGEPHPIANAVVRTHWDGARAEALDRLIATTLASSTWRRRPLRGAKASAPPSPPTR